MTKWEINDHTIYWLKVSQDGSLKLYINKETSMALVSRATLLIDANSPWRVKTAMEEEGSSYCAALWVVLLLCFQIGHKPNPAPSSFHTVR